MEKGTKILFGIGFVVLFIGIVFAWEEGDLISRELFSQQDFSEQGLDCRHDGTIINLDEKPVTINIEVSCLSAEIYSDEEIVVIRQKITYPIKVFGSSDQDEGEMYTLQECVQQGYTPKQCWNNYYKPIIIDQVKEKRGKIRAYLNDLRDPVMPEDIDPSDFVLTEEELND